MPSQILIVDDSRTVRVLLETVLGNAGFETIAVSNGNEALACLQQSVPALLILDIQMPEMDGYAVCHELKSLGAPFDQLPVVFLTSLESHALDLLGDEMGAYLHKPIDETQLLEVVRRFVVPASTSDFDTKAHDHAV